MTDLPPVTQTEVTWEWRTAIGIGTMLFNGSTIWWILLYGKSENMLHQNALSWSYIGSITVLAGLGLNAALPYIAALRGK
jgi:hypothetical protein